MRKLHLGIIIGFSLLGIIMVPSMVEGTVFHEYFYAKECFEIKEFHSRVEADQEYNRWKNALGDKFAGWDMNGLTDKSVSPIPLRICVFTNQ